jgi:hypothetical protein
MPNSRLCGWHQSSKLSLLLPSFAALTPRYVEGEQRVCVGWWGSPHLPWHPCGLDSLSHTNCDEQRSFKLEETELWFRFLNLFISEKVHWYMKVAADALAWGILLMGWRRGWDRAGLKCIGKKESGCILLASAQPSSLVNQSWVYYLN